jgi:dipeptidyl-peptidase 4
MKKSNFQILIVLVLFFMNTQQFVYAQTNKLDPYSITTSFELYPNRIWIMDWIPQSNDIAISKDMRVLQRISFPSKKTSEIVTLSQLNDQFDELAKEKNIEEISKLRRLPSPQWKDKNSFVFEHNNMYFQFDVDEKKLRRLNTWSEDAKSIDYCQANDAVAFIKEKNLHISIKGKEIAVTNETEDGIRFCDYVHREEFGIKKGTFWSPNGNCLAFYRMDERDVTDYPLVDVTARVAEYVPEKYPMAGMASHYVTLGVYHLSTNTTVYMKTGEPKEQYLTAITWSPDEKYVFMGLLNREQNHLKMNMYDALSGEYLKTLFEEKSEKYVEPLNPLHFLPGSNTDFLWLSQQDGYMHLYHYNTSGKLIKQLTKGEWVVTDLLGFDQKGEHVFIHSTKESPIEQHVYSVQLKTGKINKITKEKGTHAGSVSQTGEYVIDSYSSTSMASKYQVLSSQGKHIETLLENADHLKGYAMPSTEIFTIKNSEGTDLYCRLIKPHDFDPKSKYPVIIYVYGGPHAQLITDSWLGGAGLFLNYLAQEGFLVFTLDNRGSANRGYDFETALHRNMGSVEIDDQLEGVNYLKSLPYVDSQRIGVHGWSYGGYLTIGMMLREPDLFKVGVAGGPVTDWKYYEIMYGERYMGTPENNPEGYEKASLLNKVDRLSGRLLIIHGAVDPVVVWQHSLMFLEKSIEAKKLVDYFVYPTEEHNVGWGNRGHLHEKIYRYFKDFL